MASVYDRYLALKAAQQLNQPDAYDRQFNRMDREHAQMIKSQGMTLEYQKLAEQKKQSEFERHKDLIAIEAEYGAAMGQEMKNPTDPRLTQTHKAATAKGRYTRHGDVGASAAARQKTQAAWLAAQQRQANYERSQAERERANRERATGQAGMADAISGKLKSNQAINQLRGAIGLIDSEIRRSEKAGVGMDPDRAKAMLKERDRLTLALNEAIRKGAAGTGLGITEALGLFNQPGGDEGSLEEDIFKGSFQ